MKTLPAFNTSNINIIISVKKKKTVFHVFVTCKNVPGQSDPTCTTSHAMAESNG